jgi:hypothetical protein
MWGVRRLAPAIVLAAVKCAWVGQAAAEAMQSGREDSRYLFFSGTNLWRDGSFLHGGLLVSPGGLDNDGFMFEAVISGGSYRYRSGALGDAQVYGREFGAVIAPGWRFKRDALEIKAFAGRSYRLSPDDPAAGLRGHHTGAHGALNVWYEPTPGTMAAADASFSSVGKNVSARGAFGWRVLDKFYLGPETEAFVCQDYRQYRLGFHVTGFKTGTVEWSGAIGWAKDSDSRTGAYFRAGRLTRR